MGLEPLGSNGSLASIAHALPTARAWVAGTIGLGGALLGVALVERADAPLETLALLAAAVVFTELFQVPSDETSAEPGDAHSLTFSSGVHIGAALLIGPWTAALVAAFGVVSVDRLRGAPWKQVAYNASVFSLAAAAGGGAYIAAGGTPGTVPSLPGDFVPLGALALSYYAVDYFFMGAVVALHTAQRFWPLVREAALDGIAPALAETGLAFGFAFFVLYEPWALVALVPLLLGVYRAAERLARLRRETAQALETFANVVDERDVSTFRHSARVADDVQGLAKALGAPSWATGRLRWMGRLHDLGKISIDASVLRKAGPLDDSEWAALRRHPRLSARLLRRFHLAVGAARAVELHHERFDGTGYYRADPADIPIASHLLVVVDSFDAMTSDRPYRKGLPPERALVEIEAGAGTQFHPALARAFVAYKRGDNPCAAITRVERDEILRGLSERPRSALPRLDLSTPAAAGTGVAAAFLALVAGRPELTAPGLALVAVALILRRLETVRVTRIAERLDRELEPASPTASFECVRRTLADHAGLQWLALVAWDERELNGTIELSWSRGLEKPSPLAVTSWILREADGAQEVLTAAEGELGPNAHVAVPLVRDDRIDGFLVLAVASRPAISARALAECSSLLARSLLAPERSRAVEAEEPVQRLRAVGG